MSKKDEKQQESVGVVESVDSGLSEEQEAALGQLQPDFVPPNDKDEKSSKAAEKAQSIHTVTMVLGGVFEVLAVRLGEHWRLDPKEANAIAVPAVEVMDKYLPEFENGPEVALVAAVGMVVLPRVLAQKQLSSNEPEGAQNGDKSAS
jgi:hypothetical protein